MGRAATHDIDIQCQSLLWPLQLNMCHCVWRKKKENEVRNGVEAANIYRENKIQTRRAIIGEMNGWQWTLAVVRQFIRTGSDNPSARLWFRTPKKIKSTLTNINWRAIDVS